jgi:C4-dicarboxylate transporter
MYRAVSPYGRDLVDAFERAVIVCLTLPVAAATGLGVLDQATVRPVLTGAAVARIFTALMVPMPSTRVRRFSWRSCWQRSANRAS